MLKTVETHSQSNDLACEGHQAGSKDWKWRKKISKIKNALLPAVNEVFVFEQMKSFSRDLLNKQKGVDRLQVVVSLM